MICTLYVSIAGAYSSSILMFMFSVKSRMATGYDAQGNEESAFDLGWIGPAGQMYSTLNDLMKVRMYGHLW